MLLERSTYSDQIKYTCLGGIVLSTGVMAGLAGGYAFYTIFEPKGSAIVNPIDWGTVLLSLLFGCLWGMIIYNIDRFIVTSTGKGDGTEAITIQEIKSAIPRIVMGAIIAMTISKPIEIRMFKTEIDVKLHEKQMEQQSQYKRRIEANYKGFVDEAQKDIDKLNNDLNAKQSLYDQRSDELTKEIQGRVGSGKAGLGPAANVLQADVSRIKSELDQLKEKTNDEKRELLKTKDLYTRKIDTELAQSEKVAGGLDGLLERIKLSHEIAGFWISLFITLLFMAIELTPIFFKLMLTKGPYDFLEDNIKELVKAENGIYVQYNYYKDKQGQERDLVTYLQPQRRIDDQVSLAKAQEELSAYALAKWKEQQKRKIDEDVSQFVNTQPEETLTDIDVIHMNGHEKGDTVEHIG